MSDTAPRNAVGAPQMLADALLRSMTGTTALLRVTSAITDSNMSELGIVATTFSEVVVGPVVMHKLRPTWKQDEGAQCELMVSATSVQEQVISLDLPSAQSLFAMTLAVTVGGQDYLIESVSSSEAFGQVYLYRLLLRQARQQAV